MQLSDTLKMCRFFIPEADETDCRLGVRQLCITHSHILHLMKSNAPTWILVIAVVLFAVGIYMYTKSPPNYIPPVTSTTTVYSDAALGVSLTLPKTYTIDATQVYQVENSEGAISGVTFVIPESMATGTNLSLDTAISVMKVNLNSTSTVCSPYTFISKNSSGPITTLTRDQIVYMSASSTQAGAGNRFEETVYSTLRGLSCYGIRYFVHYGVYENYPMGTITRFDMGALLSAFDTIRDSLVLREN
jgi:hypothetical protein